MEEEWEAAMAALRDLHVTANRLCGEAAQDKAKADYEIIYENSIARADGLGAEGGLLSEYGSKPAAPTVDALKSAGCVVSPPNPALLCYLLT
ncbi:MAG TPA: hypothetical protein VN890_09530 [Methylocella sp.]|nr:hypothetical protein [Methylocella sp.]